MLNWTDVMCVVLLKSMLFPCNMEEEKPMTHDEIMQFYIDKNHHKDFKIWLSRQASNTKQFIDRHLNNYVQTWAVHLEQNKLILAEIEHLKKIQIEMKNTHDHLKNMQQQHEVSKREHNLNLAQNQAMKKALQHTINAFRRESHSGQLQRKPVSHNHSNQSDYHSNQSNHTPTEYETYIQNLIYQGQPVPGDPATYIPENNGYTIKPSRIYTINNIEYAWGGDHRHPYWSYKVKGGQFWEKYNKSEVQKLERIEEANGVRHQRNAHGHWFSSVWTTPYHVPLDLTA